MEAPPRFELGNQAFAELCLTTWLWCHASIDAYVCTLLAYFDVIGARDEIFASGSHRRALLPSTSRKLPLCGQPNSRMSRSTLYSCTLLAYFDVIGARDEIFASGSHRRALLPSTSRKLPLCGQPNSRMSRSTPMSVRCVRTPMSLERETRFELATFALARQRSTTEPLSHILLVETIGLEPMTPCL